MKYPPLFISILTFLNTLSLSQDRSTESFIKALNHIRIGANVLPYFFYRILKNHGGSENADISIRI